MSDTSIARARARDLAKAQATDNEIRATLRTEGHDPAILDTMADELLDHRWAGRANLRCKLYRLADGDPELAKEMTRSSIAALHLFGAQHLGYTGVGMDEKVRKQVERAERDAAKRGKLRAV